MIRSINKDSQNHAENLPTPAHLPVSGASSARTSASFMDLLKDSVSLPPPSKFSPGAPKTHRYAEFAYSISSPKKPPSSPVINGEPRKAPEIQENDSVQFENLKDAALFENGEKIRYFEGDLIKNADGTNFSGVVDAGDDGLPCAYIDGVKISVWPEKESLIIEQGKLGNCFLLSSIVSLVDKEFEAKIRESVKFKKDGALIITFEPHQIDSLFLDLQVLSHMAGAGYTLKKVGNKLEITIARGKINSILKERQTSRTNSLYVKTMEHIVANLSKDPMKPRDLLNSLDAYGQHVRYDYIQAAANLLGKRIECVYDEMDWKYESSHRSFNPDASKEKDFHQALSNIKSIPNQNVTGYYLSMRNLRGNGRHAYSLKEVKIVDGRVEGIELRNPHNISAPQSFTFNDVLNRDAHLIKFF